MYINMYMCIRTIKSHARFYVNTHRDTVNTIGFQRIWWINKSGRLSGYSLVLVHYIDTGKLWQVKRFGG